jgi:hypothetical protein
MASRRRLGSSLPLACAALALLWTSAAAPAADTPPSKLHFVDGHWTAWDPPVPPEGAKVHIVVPGDTFWDLAAKNLGNPYLWPQLWEKNQYVRDAHWIYPGDPLVIDLQVSDTTTLAEGAAEPGAGEGEGAAAAGGDAAGAAGEGSATEDRLANVAPPGGRVNPPVPLGSQDDIYCSGFIGDPDLAFGYSVVGSEYEVLSPQMLNPVYGEVSGIYGAVDTVKYQLTQGDIIYVDGGRAAGLSAGSVFTAVAPRHEVRHPISGDLLGRRYDYKGRVRILSVQETTAIAEIVQSCDGIVVGMALRPFEPEPVPLARRTPMRPVNDPTTEQALAGAPMIVSASLDQISLGQDHVVFIDRGEADDVYPGDIFTIYRTNKPAMPPVVLGELAVLSVQDHTALAKIIASRFPIYLGDRLERK